MSVIEAYSADELDARLARANPEQRELILVAIEDALKARRYDWTRQARPEQLAPDWAWLVWLILAGRGFGKTRTGAEWAKSKVTKPGVRVAVVAPTSADARDTCIEGESGLLNLLPRERIKAWNRSLGELVLTNGSRVKCFSGDEPERLRGPQHHYAWVDELAAFRYPESYDQLMFGLRLGDHPQVVVTTTPKPTKLIRDLVERHNVAVTRGDTFANAANLAPVALAELKARYEGTRLGRQELYAELLLDVPGAIASVDELDAVRVADVPELQRTVVSVDPAVTDTMDSDETGIAVQARGMNGQCYAVEDLSCRAPVDVWARRAVSAAVEFSAGMILYEKNQGADAIGSVLAQAMREMDVRDVVLKDVTASQSKFDRALTLQQAIQQGRWHLVGSFPDLEEQLTSFTADFRGPSPDRLDAFVHGFRELMLGADRPKSRFRG